MSSLSTSSAPSAASSSSSTHQQLLTLNGSSVPKQCKVCGQTRPHAQFLPMRGKNPVKTCADCRGFIVNPSSLRAEKRTIDKIVELESASRATPSPPTRTFSCPVGNSDVRAWAKSVPGGRQVPAYTSRFSDPPLLQIDLANDC